MMDKVQKRKLCQLTLVMLCSLFCLTHDNLVMQALIWLHMLQFRVIQFGMV